MYIPKTEYYELPNKYDKTVVRLLVQSPTRMFVYWQVSDDFVKNFNLHHRAYAEWSPVLKIRNITMNYSYDLPIDPFTTNYYIEVKDPDCEYQVELGRRLKNEFVNIYTSNSAQVPRSSPLPINDYEEVIYRNYIKLDMTDKFTIYSRKNGYFSEAQDYTKLAFSDEIGTSSFGRYDMK